MSVFLSLQETLNFVKLFKELSRVLSQIQISKYRWRENPHILNDAPNDLVVIRKQKKK